MTSSVDGLVSGLSTSSLITQLMQAEAGPQSRLKSKVATQQSVLSAYQSLNSNLSMLKTAAGSLASVTTWSAVKANTSTDQVVATAGTGAATGSLTFDIKNLARAQVGTAVVDKTNPITTADTFSLTIGGGTPVDIDVTADKTAQGVVNAINAKGLSVKAALVTTSGGDTVLQLTATKTGTAGAFTTTGFDPPLLPAITAADALLQVGDLNNGGYTVTSSTNTFNNLMSGVTITAKSPASNVTINVSSDADGIAAKIQSMVDSANATMSEIKTQTAYNIEAKTGRPLSGDGNVRSMHQSLLSAVGNGAIGYGSFKQLGVELDKTGKLSFNKANFITAYTKDPAAVAIGATKMAQAVETQADRSGTTITANTQSRNSMIKTLNEQITNWDTRLESRRNALTKQFTGLETALGKMKNQASWLSGQLASLPSGG